MNPVIEGQFEEFFDACAHIEFPEPLHPRAITELKRFMAWRRLNTLREFGVVQALEYRDFFIDNLGTIRGLRRRYATLQLFFEWAIRMGYTDKNWADVILREDD